MLDKTLTRLGTLTMQAGWIELEGYEADDCMCREVAILALIHAIGELQRELNLLVYKPGGSGLVSVD